MAMSVEATCRGFNVTSSPLAQGCHMAEQEALRRRLIRGAAESSSSFPSSSSIPSSSSACTPRWLLSLSSPSSSCSLSLEDRSLSIGKHSSSSSTLGGTTAGSACDVTCGLRSLARGVRRKRRLAHPTTGATVCLALSVPLIYSVRRAGATMAKKNSSMVMLWGQQQRYQQLEDGECALERGKRETRVRRQRFGGGGDLGGGQMSQCCRAGHSFPTTVKARCTASDTAAAIGSEAAAAAAAAAETAMTEDSVSLASAATVLKASEEKARPSSSPSTPSRRRIGVGSRLIGCGSAVPSCVISNDDLSVVVDTSDEWIMSRTGIRRRRILSGDESLTDLAVESSRRALEMANVAPSEVDLVLLCTSTPEDMFGSACKVQAAIGATNSIAFDITAACSGFVLGLVTATRFIRGGGYKNVLVVGADALSRYVDWTDRGTCILFGDGSGAVVVQAAEDGSDGLLGFDLRSDGNGGRHLKLPILTGRCVNGSNTGGVGGGEGGGGGIAVGKDQEGHIGSEFFPSPSDLHCKTLEMNGRDVFRFAVRAVPEALEAAMEEAGLTPGLIDWLLLHQANQRILDSVAATLRIPQERVISNLIDYGNTSAASIPLALDEAVRSGQIKPGHVVATAGFGAGLTWASAIIRWG